jgi:hypothetical protein
MTRMQTEKVRQVVDQCTLHAWMKVENEVHGNY